MRAKVILTHHRGVSLQASRAHPLGELSGQLMTHMLTSKRGMYMVATLRDPNDHVGPALLELFDVQLYLIGPQSMQLRGFERLSVGHQAQYVFQGWVVLMN